MNDFKEIMNIINNIKEYAREDNESNLIGNLLTLFDNSFILKTFENYIKNKSYEKELNIFIDNSVYIKILRMIKRQHKRIIQNN